MFSKPKEFYLFLVVSIVHFTVFFLFTVNIPYWDDYVFISVIDEIQKSGSFLGVIQELFKPHNEHIIFITKFIFYGQYSLTGSINFKGTALVGAAFLYLTIWTLYLGERKLNKIKTLLISSLFLLIPINNLTNWSMVSIGWNGTNFLSVLSFYFLSKFLFDNKARNLFISILLMITGPFSMANGVLIGLIGLLGHVIYRRYNIKDYLWSFILYGICTIGSLLLYLYKTLGHKNIELDETSIDPLVRCCQIAKHFIIFVASPAKDLFNGNVTILSFLGCGIIALMLALLFRNYKEISKDPFFLMVGLFMIGSMFLISIGRSEISVEQGLRSRYLLLPLTLWFIIFRTLCLEMTDKNISNLTNYFIIGSLIFYLNKTSVQLELIKSRAVELNEGLYTYLGNDDYAKLAYPPKMLKTAADRLIIGQNKNIYNPKLAIQSTEVVPNIDLSPEKFNEDFIHREKSIFSSEDLIFLKGWVYPKNFDNFRIYAQIETFDSLVTLKPSRISREDVKIFLENKLNIITQKNNFGFEIIHPLIKKRKSESIKVFIIVQDIESNVFYKHLLHKQ